MSVKLLDFLPEFMEAVKEQLQSDELRWKDTWLHRTKDGQEERTFQTFTNYFDQHKYGGTPVPWLKIAGGALICWVRENHPELWSNKE